MGINLTWYCPEHKYYYTSMRGEEGMDFQRFVRGPIDGCFESCLRNGNVHVSHDGYFNTRDYKPAMDFVDRPAARIKQGLRESP